MAAEHLWFLTGSSFNQHCMGLHRSEGERLQLFNLARPDLGDWRGGRDDAKVGSESPDWTRQQSPESTRVGVGSDMGSNARSRAELEIAAPSWSHVSRPR